MLKQDVSGLYEALDYERSQDLDPSGSVQLFHRREGAAHTYELVWVVGDEASDGAAYQDFSLQTQRWIDYPGTKRMRIVAADDAGLKAFNSRALNMALAPQVVRSTWIGLLNEVFSSESFCTKAEEQVERYRNAASVQLRSLWGSEDVTWSYLPSRLRFLETSNSLAFEQFADQLGDFGGDPTLFVVHAPAGYGKTAFSNALTDRLAATHRVNGQRPFPVFIPFAKYRRFGGVRDILRAELEELRLYGVNSRGLLRVIHEGHAIVVLDGFDELMAEVGMQSAKANLQALKEFLAGSSQSGAHHAHRVPLYQRRGIGNGRPDG